MKYLLIVLISFGSLSAQQAFDAEKQSEPASTQPENGLRAISTNDSAPPSSVEFLAPLPPPETGISSESPQDAISEPPPPSPVDQSGPPISEPQNATESVVSEPRGYTSPTPAPTPVREVAGDCGAVHPLAAEIYMRESGCRPWAYNSSGCRGIGQACPGSKLPCDDYDFWCQHEWFEGYAFSRYGSWEAAWAFWQSRHWW